MRTHGRWIQDEEGRTLLLRGVNLSGSAKVPVVPSGGSHLRQGLESPESASFVGRPLAIAEADEHFARLRAFGHHFLRLVITWEAIEHAGPGQYDRAYLDYLRALVEQAGRYDLQVFVDPHQDVWSRFTGGDGAPAWTLDAVGMRREHLVDCGAAVVHAYHQGPLPAMIWPTNYVKLGAATMFTLFFGGNDFAPSLLIDGEPVQEYLQRHYVAAICEVARTLHGLPNVSGYGTMNEPSAGLIGVRDLQQPMPGMVAKGPSPSPLQSMAAAAGFAQEVPVWEFSASFMGEVGTTVLNPQQVSLWRSPESDPWRREGVWDVVDSQPRIAKPDHFASVRGRPVCFSDDYLKPLLLRVLHEVRKTDSGALIFFEGPPAPVGQPPAWGDTDPGGVVHAGHFYDGMALMSKHYDPEFTIDTLRMQPVFGREQVETAYAEQIGALADHLPSVPFLLGEFGIPFDLDGGRSFQTGDYSAQEAALDGYFQALDRNLVSGTLWNYTPDNDQEHGDQWNGEDLSIYSRSAVRGTGDLYDGGRALASVVRPYAKACAGTPLAMSFSRTSRRFHLRIQRSSTVSAPTIIFIPKYQYPSGFSVEVSTGTWEYEESKELLIWHAAPDDTEQSLQVMPR